MNKLKNHDFTIVMEDFYVKLGLGQASMSVSPFGPGKKNNRVDRLEIFSESNTMIVINIWVRLLVKKLYMWKS